MKRRLLLTSGLAGLLHRTACAAPPGEAAAAGDARAVPTMDLGLMLNLDGDLSFTGATAEESRVKLERLVDDIHRAPVRTVMWSIGAGSDILYYPTQVASTWGWRPTPYDDKPAWQARIQRCKAAAEAGLDAPRIAGGRARALGLRFIPSYRMNDAHYCSDPHHYPLTGRFWVEHPQAVIGASPVPGNDNYQHLLNYEREEVRAYRMGVVLEAMERYQDLMDGFELDFNRFQIFFPPGRAAAGAPLITAMVRQARARLQEISGRQGRPMALVVRVPPAQKNCAWAGLEVAGWMREGLVDVVVPAQVMTLAHDMPLDEFAAAARGTGCMVAGSIYGRGGYQWPFSARHTAASYAAEVTRTPDVAQVYGAALNHRHLGATGAQLYNFSFFSVDPPYMLAVARGLAEPARMREQDRRYQVTQAYYLDREDSYEYRKQAPAPLPPGGALRLRLLVGEDLAAARPRPAYVGLRLGLYGGGKSYAGLALEVRLNGRPLHSGPCGAALVVTTGKRHGNGAHAPPTEAYAQWPLADLSHIRPGWNEVELTLPAGSPLASLQCVEAEIGVVMVVDGK